MEAQTRKALLDLSENVIKAVLLVGGQAPVATGVGLAYSVGRTLQGLVPHAEKQKQVAKRLADEWNAQLDEDFTRAELRLSDRDTSVVIQQFATLVAENLAEIYIELLNPHPNTHALLMKLGAQRTITQDLSESEAALYRNLLDRAVRHLHELAPTLDFSTAAWKRLFESDYLTQEMLNSLQEAAESIQQQGSRLEQEFTHSATQIDNIHQLLTSHLPPMTMDSTLGVAVVTTTRPLKPSDFFRGRDSTLAIIKNKLIGSAKLLLLNGMGGIGKTEICRKLFHDAVNGGLQEVTKVGWITYAGSIEQSLFLHFPEIKSPSFDTRTYLSQCEQYINSLGGSLLLFVDNANDISPEDAAWLLRTGCKIVLTSRRRSIDRLIPVEIGKLDWDDCRILYRQHSEETPAGDDSNYGVSYEQDDSPDKDIDAIITLAQRHTLAIELLAKTQIATGKNAKQMRRLLEESGFSLAEVSESISYTHNPELGGFDKNEQVFMEQLSKVLAIANIRGESLRILQLLALLASEPILTETAQEWLHLESLAHVNELVDTGWVFRGRVGDESYVAYSVHPLVASVVQHSAMPSIEVIRPLIAAVTDSISVDSEDEYRTKLPFLSHANALIDSVQSNEEDYVALINKTCVILYNLPALTRAQSVLAKGLSIVDSTLGDDSPTKATTYHNMGYVQFLLKDYPASISSGQTALALRKNNLGEESTPTALTINILGRAFDGMCNYPLAMEYFNQATTILSSILGKDDPVTVHISNNIGVTWFHMGDYLKAHEAFQSSLASLQASLGEGHADTARAYHNVASARYALGEYEGALEIALKAETQYRHALGDTHHYVAEISHNIACMHEKLGNLDNALTWHKTAISIREEVFGTDSPDTAESYSGIASVLTSLKRFEEALPYYQNAVDIYERHLGDTHDDTAEAHNGISGLYLAQGVFSLALKHVDRAIDIYESVLPESHPYIAEAYNTKGGVYFETRDYQNAKTWYEKALKIRLAVFGDDHTDTAESLSCLGSLYQATGDTTQAIKYLVDAYLILTKSYGVGHPERTKLLENIKSAYLSIDLNSRDFDAWLSDQIPH